MTDRYAPLNVTLNDDEVDRVEREAKSRAAQPYPHKYGYTGPSYPINESGCGGELAFCSGLGLAWVTQIKLPDVSWYIQVRCSPCRTPRPPTGFGNLIVRPEDDPNDCFALVVGNLPHYVLLGWIEGKLARQDRWRREEAGRPPAWFVPNAALNKNLDQLLRLH